MSNHRYRRIGLLAVSALALGVAASGHGAAAGRAGSAETATTSTPDDSTATSEPDTSPTFNQELHDTLPDDIRSDGYMTLATDPTDPPLEFYDEDNELVGAEIDLAAALGVVLGIEVRLEPARFDTIIPGIEAGRFDGSVSGFADRVERQEVVDFVDYFTTSRGYLIQTGTNSELAEGADLCGLTVAVAQGTTMAESILVQSDECVAAGEDAIEDQIFPDQSACVLAVQSGRADLTILPAHAALWIAETSDGALDVILKPTEGNDINGIALRKGDLVEPVQGAIQQLMDSGTLRAIFTEWGLEAVVLDEATVNAGTN